MPSKRNPRSRRRSAGRREGELKPAWRQAPTVGNGVNLCESEDSKNGRLYEVDDFKGQIIGSSNDAIACSP